MLYKITRNRQKLNFPQRHVCKYTGSLKCKQKCQVHLPSTQTDLEFLFIAFLWRSLFLRLSSDITIWKGVSDKCGVTYSTRRSQVIKKLTVNKK